MPPTVAISCPALGIQLDQTETPYIPGDVIIGQISRTAPTVAPHARLTVTLYGRAESCMIMTRGMAYRDCSGSFNLFDPGMATKTLFSDKPLHIEPGRNASWPFAITIPSSIDYDTLNAQKISKSQSFLPLDPEAVATQSLPSSFRSRKFSSGIGAYIEYVLEAELELSERGKTRISRAAQPVQIGHFTIGPPIANFQLTRRSHDRRIVSQRLIPGLKDGELSFSQRAQQFIGSSKLPNFVFKVHVDLPTVLQVGNTNPMPLRIGIEPLWDRTTEIIREVSQRIKIESLSVRLELCLKIKCRDYKAFSSHEVDIITPEAVRTLDEDIFLAWDTPDDSDSKQASKFIDVGELLDFRLGKESLVHLYPSFTTYNIQHSHRLSCDLRGVFDDERIKVVSSHEVTVLPSSDARDEPPSFAESQFQAAAGA